MTNKKRVSKGVNGTGCTHDRCGVLDTHTEYNDVLQCLDCQAILTRPEWDRLHKKSEGINWIDKISDEGYAFLIYFALYFLFMLIAWGLTL